MFCKKPVIPSKTTVFRNIGYRYNDCNSKKKKEITPAGNRTQRTSYTPLGIPFFASVTQRKRYGKKQRSGKHRTERTAKVQSPCQRAGIRRSHKGVWAETNAATYPCSLAATAPTGD